MIKFWSCGRLFGSLFRFLSPIVFPFFSLITLQLQFDVSHVPEINTNKQNFTRPQISNCFFLHVQKVKQKEHIYMSFYFLILYGYMLCIKFRQNFLPKLWLARAELRNHNAKKMSAPIFPKLIPSATDPLWFNVDKPCDDENELSELEEEYQSSVIETEICYTWSVALFGYTINKWTCFSEWKLHWKSLVMYRQKESW